MALYTTKTLLLLAAIYAGGNASTLPKANEYSSPDCTGALNYGHHSAFLTNVNMDATSHSVYLATPDDTYEWVAWSGANCGGTKWGALPNECNNLDRAVAGRITCVSLTQK
ncbi:hypothetical protein BD289DRAFT_487504 [Coniella lustricola]|uniref:Small secreted protein n=1 Tax=Coniella lustricola TaxID=2025994 RepID=A0A2T2ZRS1_9PEZI|nr:hypothetical protein BD289DRAFT_487504 [Coniella lustricola]